MKLGIKHRWSWKLILMFSNLWGILCCNLFSRWSVFITLSGCKHLMNRFRTVFHACDLQLSRTIMCLYPQLSKTINWWENLTCVMCCPILDIDLKNLQEVAPLDPITACTDDLPSLSLREDGAGEGGGDWSLVFRSRVTRLLWKWWFWDHDFLVHHAGQLCFTSLPSTL